LKKRSAGFTMVELIVVMVLVGILAAIGVPRLMGENGVAAAAFGDEVVSALRTAQKSAVAKRRLVCASVGGSAATLRIAAQAGAAGCDTDLDTSSFTTTAGGVAASTHALFFQPNGTITSDAAGTQQVRGNVAIQLNGRTVRSIAFEGSTGHVQ
jgi:MSHA pilin protein MshC